MKNAEQENAQTLVDQIVEAQTFQEPRFQISRSLWWTPYGRLRRAGRVAKRRARAKAETRRAVSRSLTPREPS